MKYRLEIDLALPRERVIELFDDPDNMPHWQQGFLSFEPMSGTPGEIGAKSRLKYQMGKRQIEMVETIIGRNLPEEFSATYEADGVWNEIRNYFTLVPDGGTKWITENEFKPTNFMMRVMMLVMPSAFKKQSFKYMEDFKAFAEGTNE